MAVGINDVLVATTKPYQEQIRKLQRAIGLVYEKLDTRAHEGHKHYHGGCLFCAIEQALKDQPESKETELERLAKKAARTGNRKDLQEYLKARRNAR